MKKVIILKSLHRMLCTLSLLCAGVVSTMATSTFYYAANAYVSPTQPTAGGKVYVSSSATTDPQYQNSPHRITGSQKTVGYGEVTLYYYAQANEGFIFDHWAKGSASGETVGTSSSYTASAMQFTSTNPNNRTTFNYYAVFTAQTGLITVRSANDNLGGVSISNPNNKITDTEPVTLTANPDISNGVMFLGWKKNNQGDLITDNPLVLTVSEETEGTYWAYFSEPAEKVYIRLKNNKTKRFLSFYGTGTASAHTRDLENDGTTYKDVKDGFIFDGSFKMIEPADAQGNPSTVFLRSGHAQGTGVTTGADFSAHGISYSTLVGANPSTNKYMLTMEGNGSSVRIYTTYTVSVKHWSGTKTLDLPTYLCDEGGDYAVMKTIKDLSEEEQSAAEWTLYSLDETTTEGAFGANTKAKYTKDNLYYTTMYTDFPYKLLDGVNAYYLVFNEEFSEITDRVVFTQVEGGKVAANTAVILECPAVQNDINSTTTVTNRLLPLTDNYPSMTVNPGKNYLRGYISVNGSTEPNNKQRMYVLSSKNGTLGFYHSNKDNMTPNKAYLLIPEGTEQDVEEHAKDVTICFGYPDDFFSEPTKIVWSNLAEDTNILPVFDLQGRKVSDGSIDRLPKGIYIRNGKKFVVK